MAYGEYTNDELDQMSDAELVNALHVGRNIDRHVMQYLKAERPKLLLQYMGRPDVSVPDDLQEWVDEQSAGG